MDHQGLPTSDGLPSSLCYEQTGWFVQVLRFLSATTCVIALQLARGPKLSGDLEQHALHCIAAGCAEPSWTQKMQVMSTHTAETGAANLDLSLSRRRKGAPALDAIDEAIVWELMKDARITNAALAERVHVSPSTTINRVRALRDSGVIRSTHAQVDYNALGFPVMAIVAVRLKAQARTELKAFAQRTVLLAPVVNLFFLGGPEDFLIHLVATSTDQLRDFVASDISMDKAVASTQTFIVFDYLVGNQHMEHVSGFEEVRNH